MGHGIEESTGKYKWINATTREICSVIPNGYCNMTTNQWYDH